MTEREKIYIVPGETHLRRFRPDLERTQHPFDPDAVPEEKLSEGIDCWLLQTWARLRTADTPFEPVICGHAVENAVCLFHYDTALPCWGVHRCFAVVVQADRPQPPLADMTIRQNFLNPEDAERKNIYHWPQPGILERDPERGNRIETLSYFGSGQYMLPFMQDPDFRQALSDLGVVFEPRLKGTWRDYRTTDLVLAVRNSSPGVLAVKPASKLINAWRAGTPAILGPEPAYRELRKSSLDYIEAATPRDVLAAVARLRTEPALYAAMRANGLERSREFAVDRLTARWIAILEQALEHNRRIRHRSPLQRRMRYLFMRELYKAQAKLTGWKD